MKTLIIAYTGTVKELREHLRAERKKALLGATRQGQQKTFLYEL